jgi:hypothetical protein
MKSFFSSSFDNDDNDDDDDDDDDDHHHHHHEESQTRDSTKDFPESRPVHLREIYMRIICYNS